MLSPADWQANIITVTLFICLPVSFGGAFYIWHIWQQWQPCVLLIVNGLITAVYGWYYGRVAVDLWPGAVESNILRPSFLLFSIWFTFVFVPGFAYSFKRIKDVVDSSREERERVRQLHYDWSRIMSHEIHTPLSVVYGYIGMIQEKEIPDHLRQEIDGISRGLHRLLNTASLFDAVNQRVTIHPFILQDAIREALNSDLLWVATRHKPGDVKIVFEDKQKTDIQSDKSKLKTAVAELVRNAIKVSKKGDAVRIIIHDNPDKNYLLISVIDYDGGIPIDQQNRIWEPGVQLYSDMSSRPLEGSGSGLPTVARIADMLGGSAYLEQSGLGMGSVFTIRLPRRVV